MRIDYHVVTAFTREPFGGNPAGVCPLDAWLPDSLMQRIAAENGLSETAFLVGEGARYDLRWFTPAVEVKLCGHATLATAHVLWTHRGVDAPRLEFSTKSGRLTVTREADTGRYALDLPAQPASPAPVPDGLAEALGVEPLEIFAGDDLLVILDSAELVRELAPDMKVLAGFDTRGVIVSARAGGDDDCDFVSRFFAPAVGIDEDPVTGSAHCKLVPYWAGRLGKDTLHARQISARGGELFCELRGDRVTVAGHVVDYLRGKIELP